MVNSILAEPHHGFARVYCDACGHDWLLAYFSRITSFPTSPDADPERPRLPKRAKEVRYLPSRDMSATNAPHEHDRNAASAPDAGFDPPHAAVPGMLAWAEQEGGWIFLSLSCACAMTRCTSFASAVLDAHSLA